MNVISKLIAVKYPRPNINGGKSDIIDIHYVDKIKPCIKEQLFVHNYDYVVVSYDNKLFICEKNSDTTYTRRDIMYHPLMNDLKLT
jgi:hypothetical protein